MELYSTEKTIQDLNLEDDFLFAKVMSDREICRKVLEKILIFFMKEKGYALMLMSTMTRELCIM